MIKKSNHDLIHMTKKGGKIKDCRHREFVYEIKVKIPKSRRRKKHLNEAFRTPKGHRKKKKLSTTYHNQDIRNITQRNIKIMRETSNLPTKENTSE